MEFLVTMTTQVPEGVNDAEVDEVRGREAARSRELVRDGHLLRLWRPPLKPGEWRTFGLFAAADATKLEEALASMPLRIWRTDQVTRLAPHPNDPPEPPKHQPDAKEFFTTFTLDFPDGVDRETIESATAAEARTTRTLAAQGILVRLWKLDPSRSLALWQTEDDAQLQSLLSTLPLAQWLQVDTVPLSPHPSDPALT